MDWGYQEGLSCNSFICKNVFCRLCLVLVLALYLFAIGSPLLEYIALGCIWRDLGPLTRPPDTPVHCSLLQILNLNRTESHETILCIIAIIKFCQYWILIAIKLRSMVCSARFYAVPAVQVEPEWANWCENCKSQIRNSIRILGNDEIFSVNDQYTVLRPTLTFPDTRGWKIWQVQSDFHNGQPCIVMISDI